MREEDITGASDLEAHSTFVFLPLPQLNPRGLCTAMELDTAQISLTGDRPDNQDRAEVLISDDSVLAIVADGMGGHARGDLAAETAVASLVTNFRRGRHRPREPATFLAEAIAAAHRDVLELGAGMRPEIRPGTIIVCTLVASGKLWWANVGDSRAYHLRNGRALARTRDHTVVESLIAAGEITAEQAQIHPDRHMVEYCLGVDDAPPPARVSGPRTLAAGDVILLCSDGLWSQIGEALILERIAQMDDLEETIDDLAQDAVRAGRPQSDNVTIVGLRVIDEGDG